MSQPWLLALAQGFGLGASLIIAIGAQNAFVLRQGLKRQHVFLIASLCTLCDMLLISLGVTGLGALITAIPALTIVATWGGAIFLFIYGLRSFRAASKPESMNEDPSIDQSVRKHDIILAVLGFSLLNPHAFLDTVVLIGSVGAHYAAGTRIFFALGTMLASFVWFFSLAYGAGKLAPLFRHPRAWQILDIAIGCLMWIIAGTLILSAL
jgi:L-lysine exporter family protein LysE/ArgO